MFSNFIIALIIGGGIGAWAYAKFHRSSGGNTKSSAIAAATTAAIIFIIVLIALSVAYKKIHKL